MAGLESEKTMFEVYHDTAYSGAYEVVYYTELQDYNKETAINRALAGEHFVDGYLRNHSKEEAKKVIRSLLERMNSGEKITPDAFLEALGEHLA